ncbi:hypothetical protein J3R82DRAFT_919 [Butyriboletus roseoflavus]|nr:hypothetical protein J3R82DRAFT_919 [Butyriboletus roseoflavus]
MPLPTTSVALFVIAVSLRSKKSKSSEHTHPWGLQRSLMIYRVLILGCRRHTSVQLANYRDSSQRDRDSSFCTTSQADCMAEPIADTSEQRPQKRRKRSSSTPAAPRSSQLSAQLQSRRRSQSRVGSPTADANRPSRVSARLARKIHPFINSRSSDIYMHLADPDDARNLLNEPPAGSVMLSTPNDMVGPQPRGRRRKFVDLADENAKKHFMEEWARLRQSQGALPLSGIDENACFSQMLLRDTRKGDESVSSMQLEVVPRRNTPDADLVRNEATSITNITPSQETILDVSPRDSFSTQMDFETLPAGTDASGEN